MMEKENQLTKNSGKSFEIIRENKDPENLRKVLSLGLYKAISLHTKETSEENVKIMVTDILEDFAAEPIEVVTMAIADIRKGKRKIYGMVTPTDLREMITANLEKIAIHREQEHNARKGHGGVEVAVRYSGRISDHFNPDGAPKGFLK
jgi:hypothetical protein